MLALTEAIHDGFDYRQQTTGVDSPIDEALESGEGVCQDFAHIMIACVRRLGIPAATSAAICSTAPATRSTDGATHAWVEALLPELGWVGFDPTNNVVAGSGTSAWRSAATTPTCRRPRASTRAAGSELAVAVQVSRATLPAHRARSSP